MSATRQPLKIVLTLGALLWASASFSNPLLPSQEEPNFFNVRICRDRQVLSALKTAAASTLRAKGIIERIVYVVSTTSDSWVVRFGGTTGSELGGHKLFPRGPITVEPASAK